MLRYKTETRPGIVALYDIRPGNGAGPFLQPRSPHGATWSVKVENELALRLAEIGLIRWMCGVKSRVKLSCIE